MFLVISRSGNLDKLQELQFHRGSVGSAALKVAEHL